MGSANKVQPICPLLEVCFYSSGACGLSVVRKSRLSAVESPQIAVGTLTVVRYTVDVCYWECLLTEIPLCIVNSL